MSARILRHQKHDAALLGEGAYIILFVLTKSGNTYEQPGISKRWGRLCALVSFSVGVMQSEVRERWCEPTLRHSCAPTNTHTYTHTPSASLFLSHYFCSRPLSSLFLPTEHFAFILWRGQTHPPNIVSILPEEIFKISIQTSFTHLHLISNLYDFEVWRIVLDGNYKEWTLRLSCFNNEKKLQKVS